MDVILLTDLEHVGHEGEVVKVADGYARNYLIPRKLAVPATRGALKDLENRRGAIARREAEKRAAAEALAAELREKRVVVRHLAGDGHRLHGAVTAAQIAEAASAQLGRRFDKRDIELAEPIREVGNYLVSARLYKDVRAEITVQVVPERRGRRGAEEVEAPAEEAAPVASAESAAAPDMAEAAEPTEEEV